MINLNVPFREAFPFFQQMMQDAFHIDCTLFTSPYSEDDFDRTDRGFRKMVWKDYPKTQPNTVLEPNGQYSIILTKSSLGFFSVIAFVSLGKKQDVLSVGPFRDEAPTEPFINQIMAGNRISFDFKKYVVGFYQHLPIAEPTEVANMIHHLLSAFIPAFADISISQISFKDEIHSVIENDSTMLEFSNLNTSYYASCLTSFMEALGSGKYSSAIDRLQILMPMMGMNKSASLKIIKRRLNEINSLCK